MKYSIRQNMFCALARDEGWQGWLKSVAGDLYTKLLQHLEKSTSCKSNKAVMYVVLVELDKRKLTDDLVKFLSDYYPIALKIESNEITLNRQVKIEGDPNKHKVFKSYRPYLMSFPQKIIIVDGDRASLEHRTKAFIKNMIKADYIIIEDRSYIEYFEPQYKDESEKIVDSEILQYRKKLKYDVVA